jgi:hypothetical protein
MAIPARDRFNELPEPERRAIEQCAQELMMDEENRRALAGDDPPLPLAMPPDDAKRATDWLYANVDSKGLEIRDRLLLEILDRLASIDDKLERLLSRKPKADPP